MHLKATCTWCALSTSIVLANPAMAWDISLASETNKTLVIFSRAAAFSPVTGSTEEVEELFYRLLYVEFETCRSFLSETKTIAKGETQMFDPYEEFASADLKKGMTIIVPVDDEEDSTTPIATLGLQTEGVSSTSDTKNTTNTSGLDLSPKDQQEGRPLTRFLGQEVLLFLSFGDDSESLTDTVSTTFQGPLTGGDKISIAGFNLDLLLEQGAPTENNTFEIKIEATHPETSETLTTTESVTCGKEFAVRDLFPAFVGKPGVQVLVQSADTAIAGSARESLPNNGITTFVHRNMNASGQVVLGNITVN